MTAAEASREIFWNVSEPYNVVLMYAALVVAAVIGGNGIVRHAEGWLRGRPDQDRAKVPLLERFSDFIEWVVFQKGVSREPVPGLAHALVYLGFLALLLTTTVVMIDHDFGIRIYRGGFYLFLTLLSDIFGFLLIVGCGIFAHRRYVRKEPQLHNTGADMILLGALVLLCIQGFVIEALRIHVTNDPWQGYSPVGAAVAKLLWPLSVEAARVVHYATWWFHTLTVFTVIALAPYTKFFHLIASSLNLFFRRSARPKGALPFPGDIEKLVEEGSEFSLGTATIKDYTWKQLLDLGACTSCGRCQQVCPAYHSGKPLSPKWLILDSRNHALTLNADGKLGSGRTPEPLRRLDSALTRQVLLHGNRITSATDEGGGYFAAGPHRAENELVQHSVLRLGASPDQKLMGEVMDADVFWSCTTCYACVEACPVGINHVDQIMENRRHKVLMEGELPTEAQRTIRALENRGNPFGAPEDREKWMQGLNLRVLKPGDSVECLYWVGCLSAYDPRKQKIALALVSLLQQAGVDFAVLGKSESCCGDPARRLGEENLFQTLAKKNLEVLRSIKFKYIVANCPHCFNTLKNEYPQLGNLADGAEPEVIHHSVMLQRLLKEGRINAGPGGETKITFHDPCYLGRYNDEYEAPREVAQRSTRLQILEMDRSREKSFCCGAGGGHFWMDMKIGERVNVKRIEQAADTDASLVATACPFCMQMLEDGVKLTNREGQMEVKDIAELLVERQQSPSDTDHH